MHEPISIWPWGTIDMRKKMVCFYAAGVLLASLLGCKSGPPAALLPVVRLGVPAPASEQSGIRYALSLVPFRQAQLAFKSPGIVERILEVRGLDGQMREVTMGDAVTAGVVLARVRDIDYLQKQNQANAAVQQATANLTAAKASRQLATVTYERAVNLFHDASMTKQDFDRATEQRDAADAAVKQAEAGVANAQAELDQARQALQDTAVTAPFAGVVVARQIELGNLVGNSTPAFTVADIHRLKAEFTVPMEELGSFQQGSRVALTLPDAPEPVEGAVTALSPVADPQSRVFTVEITIDNPQGAFKPGMIGSLELPRTKTARQLTVPLAALVRSTSGQFSVFVPATAGGKTHVHLVTVTIGASRGSDVEVLTGISARQQIVVAGAQTLHENDEVRVVE
jgi:multidrug efflux system membrane fusion protein